MTKLHHGKIVILQPFMVFGMVKVKLVLADPSCSSRHTAIDLYGLTEIPECNGRFLFGTVVYSVYHFYPEVHGTVLVVLRRLERPDQTVFFLLCSRMLSMLYVAQASLDAPLPNCTTPNLPLTIQLSSSFCALSTWSASIPHPSSALSVRKAHTGQGK